jgi:hypothetical protein
MVRGQKRLEERQPTNDPVQDDRAGALDKESVQAVTRQWPKSAFHLEPC